MEERQRVILTNMCMVSDGSRVLVENRKDPGWPGIAFPGGHVEAGESLTASVIREIREETGLLIENPRLCGMKDWEEEDGTRIVVLLYAAEKFTGEIHASEEGEVFWMEKRDLPRAALAYGMLDTVKVFVDSGISEFYFYEDAGVWKNAYT